MTTLLSFQAGSNFGDTVRTRVLNPKEPGLGLGFRAGPTRIKHRLSNRISGKTGNVQVGGEFLW